MNKDRVFTADILVMPMAILSPSELSSLTAQSRVGTAPRQRIVIEMAESRENLRNELQGVARDEGLTPAKLESTQLIALMRRRADLSVSDATRVLYKLIVDVVAELRGEKARTAARATLNLDGSPVQGRSAMAHQAALAKIRSVHADTVRSWWRSAVKALADTLPIKIKELNNDPFGWAAYRDHAPANTTDQPAYSFDRIDVAWRLQGRRTVDMTTARWMVARKDGLDRVNARGWYFSDHSPTSCEVIPLLNCRKLSTTYMARGVLVSELELPKTLKQGESVFYAYKVVVHSEKDTEPIFYHNTSSAGVRLLLYRVQFDPDAPPARIWTFASLDDVDAFIPPPPGSPRYLTMNRFGYIECAFHECTHGTKYGVSWTWPEGGSMGED